MPAPNLRYLKIGLLYFMLVFGAGFVLGPIRIFFVAPKVGNRAAELLECPVMILITFVAARWIVVRFGVSKIACETGNWRVCPGFTDRR